MASSNSQIDKPQCGCPKRAELPDVNTNKGAQSINTERPYLTILLCAQILTQDKVRAKLSETLKPFSDEAWLHICKG